MLHLASIASFVSIIIYSFFPGFFLYLLLRKLLKADGKINLIEGLLLSILLSFFVNSLSSYILMYLHIQISLALSLIYLFIFIIPSLILLKSASFERPNKYEKYLLLISSVAFVIMALPLLFGYLGVDHGDMTGHIDRLKGSVESGGLVKYQPYFVIDVDANYPKGFYSLLLFPLVLTKATNAIILLQSTNLFIRFVILLYGFTVFLGARIFTKSDKIAFYSSFVCLFLGGASGVILFPIFWGGWPVTMTRLLSFSVFAILWGALFKENNKIDIPVAAFIAATAVTIRPDIVVHFLVMVLAMLPFLAKYRKKLLMILVYFSLLAVAVSLLFFHEISNYLTTFISGSVLTQLSPVASPLQSLSFLTKFGYLTPVIAFLVIAAFLLKTKSREVYPLLALGLAYIVLQPILILSRIFFVSTHIILTLVMPSSILVGYFVVNYWFKLQKNRIMFKAVSYSAISIITLLFLVTSFANTYFADYALQEEDLDVLLWIRANLDDEAGIFYIDTIITSWVSPVSEKRSFINSVGKLNRAANEVFKEKHSINLQLMDNSLSKNELNDFFIKYRITHAILTHQEYSMTKNYFQDGKIIYKDSKFYIIEIFQ